MTKKKVLFTASTWRHICSFHLPYLHAFQDRGWEVHVAAEGVPRSTPYAQRTIQLPFVKKLLAPQNLLAWKRLRREIAAGGYSLVVTHTSLASFYTRMAVKHMKQRPAVVNVMHGYLYDDDTPFLKRQILLGAERLTAPETDLLLTMNEWDTRESRKRRLARRIEYIPGMGVDFSRLEESLAEDGIRLRRELGIAGDAFVLLYPAEFSKRKSQPVLIEAMTKLPPDTVLVLCGSGAALEQCRERVRRCALEERVLFPGQVQNMAVWYRMADAAVTASRSEGLPFNVMEAMYCALPVVASSVKGHTDLISDGETGLLYPYGDAAACAECIKLLRSDASLRERLGKSAAESVRRYGIDTVLDEVMGAYESALETSSLPV